MWIEVVEELRSNAYKKISFLRLEIHIYTHNYRYLPFDTQSDSASEPSESAKRGQVHTRQSLYVLHTYTRVALNVRYPGARKAPPLWSISPSECTFCMITYNMYSCEMAVTRVFHSSYATLRENTQPNGMPRS